MSAGFGFEIPAEETWVKQIKIGNEAEINQFFMDALEDKTIRGAQLVSFNSGQILITFEKKVEENDQGSVEENCNE